MMTRLGLSAQEKASLDAFIAERNAAFEGDDLTWAARQMPGAADVVEAGFHKARYECTAVSSEKRLASQRWLAERGLCRMFGAPVMIGDPLPQGIE